MDIRRREDPSIEINFEVIVVPPAVNRRRWRKISEAVIKRIHLPGQQEDRWARECGGSRGWGGGRRGMWSG